jgi:TIR domain
MNDIFISYASADRNKAELLAKAFTQQGWSVWWDRQIPPGKSFDEVIEHALSAAQCVIVLWSKDSVSSRWVKTEAAEAAARGILVPALIDKVQIPLEFKRIEAADLSDWQVNSPHIEFDQLLKTVAGILGNSASPPTQIKQPFTNAKPQSQRWWKTLPGILTISACMLVAITAVVFALFQPKFLQNIEGKPTFTAGVSPDGTPEIKSLPSKATEDQVIAPSQIVDPTTQMSQAKVAGKQSKQINLFAPENGVQLLVASSDYWKATIDGKEDYSYINSGLGKEAVYGFKGEQAATFDIFTMLISDTNDYNVKEFELLAGNESPTGTFETIGKFQVQNVKLFKTPYQEFKFPAVAAKYLKVKILSTQSGVSDPIVHEFQLFGNLK